MEIKMILDEQKFKNIPIIRVSGGIETDIEEEELRKSMEKNQALLEYCKSMEE